VKVTITKRGKKDLKELDNNIRDKIKKYLNRLRTGEFDFRKLSGSNNEWKIKVGDFRILIEIDKEVNTIFVKRVVPRKDAY
jgi:mRNA interferase RelE/StbE